MKFDMIAAGNPHFIRDMSRQFPKATASALNKTAAQAKTEIGRLVTEIYNVGANTVKAPLYVRPASPGHLQAEIQYKKGEKTIGLIKFGAREISKGVSFAVVRGQRTNLKGRSGVGFFIATMPSGHKAVFERSGPKKVMGTRSRYQGDERQPIKEKVGIGSLQMVSSARLLARIQLFISATLPKVMAHEIEYFGR